MRSILTLLALIAFITNVYAQKKGVGKEFLLSCKVVGQDTGMIIIHYRSDDEKLIHDTGFINKGIVQFSGTISQPTSVWFQGNIKSFSADDPNNTEFFIEAKKLHVTLKKNEFKKAVISGSITQTEYESLNKQKANIFFAMDPLKQEQIKIIAAKKKDGENEILTNKLDSIRKMFKPYEKEIQRIDYIFITTHPQSYISPFLILLYLRNLPIDSAKLFYNSLSPSIQRSRDGIAVANEIRNKEKGSVGNKAPNFFSKDISGKEFRLSDFKGKSYVLLDFWASWCVPCRQANPHLIELFNSLHKKGLEIVSIANDDNNKEAWANAIKKDGTGIWYHILQGVDLKKLQNGQINEDDIGEKYGIQAIPVKILINKEGMIIGRYEQNFSDLDKKLAEIFKD